jgi:hypothetical protein
MKSIYFVTLLAALVVSASAANPASPYADQAARDIKALSAIEIADLLAGKGLGYAKAAELNGYPGPAHVLELADELQLSAGQRAETRMIFSRMAESARLLGANLVSAERRLDSAFRSHRISPDSLPRMLEEIGDLDSELRSIHLLAHLEQTRILTPDQISLYGALRGYGDDAGGLQHQHDARH